jgi:hypothetical protein
MGGVNGAAAVAMLQALLSNPANLSLMMAQSPWMAQHLLATMGGGGAAAHGAPHLNPGMPSAAAPPGGMPPVDPSALAAAAQFGQQLSAAGMGNIASALNGLSLGPLQHHSQQAGAQGGAGHHHHHHHVPPHAAAGDVAAGWMPNGAPDAVFYHGNGAANGAMERTWGDHS